MVDETVAMSGEALRDGEAEAADLDELVRGLKAEGLDDDEVALLVGIDPTEVERIGGPASTCR